MSESLSTVDPDLLDLLVEHAQRPRHYGPLEGADLSLQGGNPGCGDIVTLYLKLDGNTRDSHLVELSFTGQGCTISQASASILTELVAGLSLEQILAMDYHLIEQALSPELVALRPRCATLALDTLKTAARQVSK